MRAWPIALGLMTAVSPVAFAAESARPAEPIAENSIATAKRELDALKANGPGTAAQKNEMPGLSMPALRTGEPEAPRLPRLGKDALGPQKKSGNWLIEAMEKKPERTKSDRGRNASESNLSPEEEDVTVEVENLRPEKAPAEKNDRLPAANLNPLERYMGEWMTAKDLAVLLPNLAGAGRTEGTRSADAASPAFAADALTRSTLDAALGLRSVAGQMKESAPRENPYLQALDLPSAASARPSGMSLSPSTPPPPTGTPIFSPTRPPENATPKAAVPDFAKPGDDEKYFKQLKRF